MGAPYLVITPRTPGLTIDDLLSRLGPEKFTAIEAKARIMREKVDCPHTVPDHEGFKDTLLSYFALYQKTFFNAQISRDDYWRGVAYDFAEQHLSAYKPSLQQSYARATCTSKSATRSREETAA